MKKLNVIKVPRAPARLRAFPDDTWIALKWYKPVARIGPILNLLDGHVIAGLAASTAGKECPRDIDHVRRPLSHVKHRSAATGAETSDRPGFRILETGDASLAPHHRGVLAPTPDVGRIGRTMRTTASSGMIMPRPKCGEVDL
jgi:hypothetical protein